MKAPRTINATQARNDFFNLLRESFLEKQSFIIEKGKIPMVYIIPASEGNWEQRLTAGRTKDRQLLRNLEKLRGAMKKTADSVKLLREMRMYGR